MKYDFDIPLLDVEGKPIVVSETDSRVFTAQMAMSRGLLADTKDNEGSKLARYELYLKIRGRDAAATDFTADEAKLMRDAAMTFPTLLAGQLVRVIDQKDVPRKKLAS